MTGTTTAPVSVASASAVLTDLVGDRAAGWDRAGRLPVALVRRIARAGLLCPDVPGEFGGPGMSAQAAGELTAHAGSLCSSLRSLMTSQGMAAWTLRRFGSPAQRAEHLPRLATGTLAAVAFSEPDAGSDLAAMTTRVDVAGDTATVSGAKAWVTGSAYADVLLVFVRHGEGAAVVLVPASAEGVTIAPLEAPLGCRAAGHAHVRLDDVRVPADAVLAGAGLPLTWLTGSVLTHGRLSVAWGCVGILRACLRAASHHANTRHQFGKPLAQHQLVAAHLADLLVAEQAATRLCEHASRCWDLGAPELAAAVVTAKQFAAGAAAAGAASAVQVLGSAGAVDGEVVARAYRDAKLMEIIEGSTEICRLLLAEQALAVWT
ncbi:acyl-CoA dehydrogenase family protein [Amycolatopsis mediterranei]|uniref:acyl-CoA dehydrogenase family protein n=1 Tax=Amycolatopsis mediterranei TaxID=33910 RepID=UPI00342C22B9